MDSTRCPPASDRDAGQPERPWILAIVAGLTVLRLGLIRVPDPGRRSIAEILESGIIAIVLVFLIIRPFVLQAYFIPSPSMEPTLLGKDDVGDRILVNKFAVPASQAAAMTMSSSSSRRPAGDGRQPGLHQAPDRRCPATRSEVVGGRVTGQRQGLQPSGRAADALAARRRVRPGGAGQLRERSDQADHHVKFVPDGVLADGHADHQSATWRRS